MLKEDIGRVENLITQRGCAKEETIRNMRHEIVGWSRWWKGVMITVIAGIVAALGFAWKVDDRAAAVETNVEKLGENVETVTQKVEVITVNQETLQASIKARAAEEDVDDKAMDRRMKKALLEALEEVDAPRRRRDTR